MINNEQPKTKKYRKEIKKKLEAFKLAKEWTDFISLLSSLDETLKRYDYDFVPRIKMLSRRLVQCLNPALPAGVHSKVLQTYSLIFGKFSKKKFIENFQMLTLGFFTSASNIRILSYEQYLDLIEKHILPFARELEQNCINIMIGIFPFLENENIEFFSKANSMLENLRSNIDVRVYYSSLWLCFFKEPNFRKSIINSHKKFSISNKEYFYRNEDIFVKSVCAGLEDKDILVLRGILDLVFYLSPLAESGLSKSSIHKIVLSALKLHLLRDLSLNKRIYILLGISDNNNCCVYNVIAEALKKLILGNENDLILLYRIICTLIDKESLFEFLVKKLMIKSLLKGIKLLSIESNHNIKDKNLYLSDVQNSRKEDLFKYLKILLNTIDQDLFWGVLIVEFLNGIDNKLSGVYQRKKENMVRNSEYRQTLKESMNSKSFVLDANRKITEDYSGHNIISDINQHSEIDFKAKNIFNSKNRVNQDLKYKNLSPYSKVLKKSKTSERILDVLLYILGNFEGINNVSNPFHISNFILILIRNYKRVNLQKLIDFTISYSTKLMLGKKKRHKFKNPNKLILNFYLVKERKNYYKNYDSIEYNINILLQKMLSRVEFSSFCYLIKNLQEIYNFFDYKPDRFIVKFYKIFLQRNFQEKIDASFIFEKINTRTLDHSLLFNDCFSDINEKSVECLLKFNNIFDKRFEVILLGKIAELNQNYNISDDFINFFIILSNRYESSNFNFLISLIYFINKILEFRTLNLYECSGFKKFFSCVYNNEHILNFMLEAIQNLKIEILDQNNRKLNIKDQDFAAKQKIPKGFYTDYPHVSEIEGVLLLLESFIHYSYSFKSYLITLEPIKKKRILAILLYLFVNRIKENCFNISVYNIQLKSMNIIYTLVTKKIISNLDIISDNIENILASVRQINDEKIMIISIKLMLIFIDSKSKITSQLILDSFGRSSGSQLEIIEAVLEIKQSDVQLRIICNIMDLMFENTNYIVLFYKLVSYIFSQKFKYDTNEIDNLVKKIIVFLIRYNQNIVSLNFSIKSGNNPYEKKLFTNKKDILFFSEKILHIILREKESLFIEESCHYIPYYLFKEKYSIRNKVYLYFFKKALEEKKTIFGRLIEFNDFYSQDEFDTLLDDITIITQQYFDCNKNNCSIEMYLYILELLFKKGLKEKYLDFTSKMLENLIYFCYNFIFYRFNNGLDYFCVFEKLYSFILILLKSSPSNICVEQLLKSLFSILFQIINFRIETALYKPTILFFKDLILFQDFSKYWKKEFYDVFLDSKFFSDQKCLIDAKFNIMKNFVNVESEKFNEIFYKLDGSFFLNRDSEAQNKYYCLKRIAFFILCGEVDQFSSFCSKIFEKINELINYNTKIKGYIFLLIRVMLLKVRHSNLKSLWPIIFNEVFKIFDNIILSRDLELLNETLKFIDLIFALNTPETIEYQRIFLPKHNCINNIIKVKLHAPLPSIEPIYSKKITKCTLSCCFYQEKDSEVENISVERNDKSYFVSIFSQIFDGQDYKNINLCIPKNRIPLLTVFEKLEKQNLKDYIICAGSYYLSLDKYAKDFDYDVAFDRLLIDFSD